MPVGATVLEPVGTAPGLVSAPASGDGPTIVVLPGPPSELQAMWAQAVEARALRDAVAGAGSFAVRTLRMYGMPESEIAETLRVAQATGIDLAPLEITTCLRRGEIEVVTRYGPDGGTAYAALEDLVRERHAGMLFSDDGSTVDDLVARALLDQGATIATAESCTGGLLAARLTERAGSSSYVLGGIVAYANSAKIHVAGVDPELIARHGAVSLEVAEALAFGALRRLDAEWVWASPASPGPAAGRRTSPSASCACRRASRGRAADHPLRAAARRARRRPRPLDHGGHAPRPQAPARRGRAGADRRLRRAALRGRRHPGRGARAARLLGRGLCRRRARAARDPGGAAASHARVPRVARRRGGAGDRRARHGVRGRPGEVALGEPLWLSPRRPHVLTVAVADPSGRLAELQARVSAALEAGVGHESSGAGGART